MLSVPGTVRKLAERNFAAVPHRSGRSRPALPWRPLGASWRPLGAPTHLAPPARLSVVPILAQPIQQILDTLSLLGDVQPGAVITDAGSTKSMICARAAEQKASAQLVSASTTGAGMVGAPCAKDCDSVSTEASRNAIVATANSLRGESLGFMDVSP